MPNAKEELLHHIGNKTVKYIEILHQKYWDAPEIKIAGTLEIVLPLLDFDYDSGYGSQELSGYIWYQDGTWSDRYEDAGSERWHHQKCPDCPIDI